MKKIILLGIVITLLAPVFSQEENLWEEDKKDREYQTLFDNSSPVGGYGSFGLGYSLIDEQNALSFTARGGVMLAHGFAMGIGGAGFINDYYYDQDIDLNVSLTGGYGGIFLEPIVLPRFPVHLSFPVFMGVGGISRTTFIGDWEEYEYSDVEDTDVFLIAEPGVELEINVIKFFRFCFTSTYRFASSIDLENTKNKPLDGFTFGINLKFGMF